MHILIHICFVCWSQAINLEPFVFQTNSAYIKHCMDVVSHLNNAPPALQQQQQQQQQQHQAHHVTTKSIPYSSTPTPNLEFYPSIQDEETSSSSSLSSPSPLSTYIFGSPELNNDHTANQEKEESETGEDEITDSLLNEHQMYAYVFDCVQNSLQKANVSIEQVYSSVYATKDEAIAPLPPPPPPPALTTHLQKPEVFSNTSQNQTGGSTGPPYSPLTMVLIVILYSGTIVLAILGNVLVIIVMTCGFRSSFLDISIYLTNLSVFNLLMAIFCIPFTFINTILGGRWIFGSFMCSFMSFTQSLSVNGCILTLTALAINRFFAVAYPLKYNAIKTKRQKRFSLILVWIVSILISGIPLYVNKCTKIQYVRDGKNVSYMVCGEVWDEHDPERNNRFLLGYTIWIFMQTYCLPVLILIVMYSCIISILRTRNSSSSYLQESSCTSIQMNEQYEQIKVKTRKTIRMLCVVIFTFCINWLPVHLFQIVFWYANVYKYPKLPLFGNMTYMSVLFFLCHWLSMSNSFINPIIYSFMNQRFKTDLNHLLHCNTKFEKKKYYSTTQHRMNPDRFQTAESPSVMANMNLVVKDADTMNTTRPHNTPVSSRAGSRNTINLSNVNVNKLSRLNDSTRIHSKQHQRKASMLNNIRFMRNGSRRMNEAISNANMANFNNRNSCSNISKSRGQINI